MVMFTSAEFSALTGVALSAEQYTLIERLVDGIITTETGRTWSDDPDPVVKIRRVGESGRVVLPRPVASVDEVRTIDLDGTPAASVLSGWRFDGIDSVWLTPFHLMLNGPAWWDDHDANDTVQVTWTPAAQSVPAAVTGIALAVAARVQGNPVGASSVSIDDYSQGFSGGAGISLLPSERATLARFRSRGISSQAVTAP